MRAFHVSEQGARAEVQTVERPEPGPGQILVKVAACGLNFADLLIEQGTYQDMPTAPYTLGMEAAGTVEALGPGVTAPAVGTRVAVFGGSGGLADYGVFPAAIAVPIPDQMDFETAAGFLIAYGTSHVALDHRARLQPGETLLVLGAAGGVGLTAVEIGKKMGARVIACARGADKLEVARNAGADHLIDAGADLRAEVKALGGADVVYDPVGGDLFDAAFRACKPEGRLITIGFASGGVPQVKTNHLLVKNLSVLGVYWGGYMAFRPEVVTGSLRQLMAWYVEGGLSPHISHVLPLEQARDGMELMRTRKSTGKVVITP